jgi:hypothetical protein
MRGYLEPCGCSENMRGGIGRLGFQVREASRDGTPVLYVDSGDSLFSRPQLTPAEQPQEKRKAQALTEAMKLLGIASRTVGELDNAAGDAFRGGLALPEAGDGNARVLLAGGHRVGFVSAQDAAQLSRGTTQARAAGAELVVGLVHDSLEKVLGYPGFPPSSPTPDLLVASHAPSPVAGEENRLVRTGVPTAQLQSKGRSVLRLDVSFAGSGPFQLLKTLGDQDRELAALDERIALLKKQIDAPTLKAQTRKLYQAKLAEVIQRRERLAATPPTVPHGQNAFSARFVALEATLPESPELKALVTAYDKDAAQLNLAWAKAYGQDCPKPDKGEAAYAGNESCRDCHAEAFAVWDASKHAHAYDDLARVGKNYRVDCVGCHVVGYQASGGVCRVDKVAGRQDVGCESCHGPGSLHVDDPSDDNIVRKPNKERCVSCHDPENSPHFDFALFVPEILGPGHGKPPPDAGSGAQPKKR